MSESTVMSTVGSMEATKLSTEIWKFDEEKHIHLDNLQQRIKSLQPAVKRKRSVSPDPEANKKKTKTEGDTLDYTVNNGFTEVML